MARWVDEMPVHHVEFQYFLGTGEGALFVCTSGGSWLVPRVILGRKGGVLGLLGVICLGVVVGGCELPLVHDRNLMIDILDRDRLPIPLISIGLNFELNLNVFLAQRASVHPSWYGPCQRAASFLLSWLRLDLRLFLCFLSLASCDTYIWSTGRLYSLISPHEFRIF